MPRQNQTTETGDCELVELQENFRNKITCNTLSAKRNDNQFSRTCLPLDIMAALSVNDEMLTSSSLSNVSEKGILEEKVGEVSAISNISRTKRAYLTKSELLKIPNVKLLSLIELLRSKVEGTSEELVFLLQERQRLRDEVDTRNIAIEQLLKVQEKFHWRLTEPLAIQMSVIIPTDENDDIQ